MSHTKGFSGGFQINDFGGARVFSREGFFQVAKLSYAGHMQKIRGSRVFFGSERESNTARSKVRAAIYPD